MIKKKPTKRKTTRSARAKKKSKKKASAVSLPKRKRTRRSSQPDDERERELRVAKAMLEDPDLSPLGKKLLALRVKILKSGQPLLTPKQVEREVAVRRGGWQEAE